MPSSLPRCYPNPDLGRGGASAAGPDPAEWTALQLSLATVFALFGLGIGSGLVGSLIGIGGGIIIVPVLVLAFGFDIRVAVAASLVAVVATSTAAGSAYIGSGLTNMRLAMTLEVATTVGGISGGLVAVLISPSVLAGVFGVAMAGTAALVARGTAEDGSMNRDQHPVIAAGSGHAGGLDGSYRDTRSGKEVQYRVRNLPLGSMISYAAGLASGLLGVGGGFLKVPAMTLAMDVPIKVAAATSNFMIGVTAISSLFVYFGRGFVHPFVVSPIALGTVAGALAGSRLQGTVSPDWLRRLLAVVLLFVAVQMMFRAAGVSVGS